MDIHLNLISQKLIVTCYLRRYDYKPSSRWELESEFALQKVDTKHRYYRPTLKTIHFKFS